MGVSNQKSYRIPYKIYVATVSQTGENDPVAVVLENTFGGELVWSRMDVGQYEITLSDAFPDMDKVIFFAQNSQNIADADSYAIHIKKDTSSENFLQIETLLARVSTSDDVMHKASIEIRVYP